VTTVLADEGMNLREASYFVHPAAMRACGVGGYDFENDTVNFVRRDDRVALVAPVLGCRTDDLHQAAAAVGTERFGGMMGNAMVRAYRT
jgi:hypothetical protein